MRAALYCRKGPAHEMVEKSGKSGSVILDCSGS